MNIASYVSRAQNGAMLLSMQKNLFDSVKTAISPILMRSEMSDMEAVKAKYFFPEWVPNFEYKQGWIISYNDSLFRIGQDHTSQDTWIPGEEGTGALYSKIELTEEGYEIWKEWDGVSGSYAKDQIVQDPNDGKLYKSLIENNVWGPPSEQPSFWALYE